MKADPAGTMETQPPWMLRELGDKAILEVQFRDDMSRDDHQRLISELERRIEQNGKIRLLVILHEFHGWHLAAIWQDIKFDIRHFNHLERIAVVGENRWQEWMATLCMPFTTGDLRFFHQDKIEEARGWVQER
jgi:hypothetical protein